MSNSAGNIKYILMFIGLTILFIGGSINSKTNTPVKPGVKVFNTLNSPKKVFKKLAAGYIVEYGMMLTEGQDYFMTSGFIYTTRKVFRFGLWGLTRKTKLGKLSVCSVACIVASYEIYRLLFPTNTKIDAFLKGAGFTAEKFLTDSAVYKRLD